MKERKMSRHEKIQGVGDVRENELLSEVRMRKKRVEEEEDKDLKSVFGGQ